MAVSPVGNIAHYMTPQKSLQKKKPNLTFDFSKYGQDQTQNNQYAAENVPPMPGTPAPKTEATTQAPPPLQKKNLWYNDPTKLEAQRQKILQNGTIASSIGMDPKISQNPQAFSKFMQEYNRRVSAAMQGQTLPQNAEAAAAMSNQIKQQVGKKLSDELLQGAIKSGGGLKEMMDYMNPQTPGGIGDVATILKQFGDGVAMPMETYNSIVNGGMLNDYQKWWFEQNRQAILSGKIPGAQLEQMGMSAGSIVPGQAEPQTAGKPGGDMAAAVTPETQPSDQMTGAETPASTDGTVPGATTEEPPADQPANPFQGTQDYNAGTGSWENTYAGQLGVLEDNEHAREYNRLSSMLENVQQYNNDPQGFYDMWYRNGMEGRHKDGKMQYWANGAWRDQAGAVKQLEQWQQQNREAMVREQHQTDFISEMQNWADEHQYGSDPLVDPFGDENGWNDAMKGIFGDLQDMPDSGALLKSFMDLYPIDEFSPEAMPDATPEERRAAYFESMKEQGIDIEALEQGDNEARTAFFETLRQKALALDPEKFLQIEDADYNKIKDTQLGYIIEQLNAQPEAVQLDYGEIEKQLNAQLKPAERQMMKDLQYRLRAHAAAGRGVSSAVGKTMADMQADFHATKTATASKMIMDAQYKNADLMSEAIKNVQAGKLAAMEQLSSIREGDLDAMLKKADLYGTAVGDTLKFIADMGNISVGEAEVDARNFATKADQHMKVAELELKGQLELAGLDLEQYRIDKDFDTNKMRIDLEAHFQKQGLDLDAAKLKAEQVTSQWQAATAAASMVQNGETDRLMQMASLALKAQEGDREAWGQYNQMVLTQQLQNRGMDINLSTAVASLQWAMYSQKNEFNFEEWRTRFAAEHEREMLELGLDAGNDAGWMDLFGDFIGTAGSVLSVL